MPICLTREQIYDIIQRELPDDTYVTTTRPGEFLTTSDDDSTAHVLEGAYATLCTVYANYFPQTAVEFLADWELKVFGYLTDSVSGIEFRQNRVLNKLRSRKGIRPWDIKQIVMGVIGIDKEFEIIEYGTRSGSWIIGESELSINTYLNVVNGVFPNMNREDLWELSAAELGITEETLAAWKFWAYGYRIKLLNYHATPEELAEIDRLLTKYEPARSHHIIENAAVLTDATVQWIIGYSLIGEGTFLN